MGWASVAWAIAKRTWRIWLPILLALCVLLWVRGYLHDLEAAAFKRGGESRNAEVAALKDQVSGYDITLKAQAQELAKRDELDRNLAKQASEAVKKAQDAERDASKALDKALDRLREATRKPECDRILKMDLAQCGL